MTRYFYLLRVVVVVFATLLLSTGCDRGSEHEPIKFVPADAATVISVDLGQIPRDSEDFGFLLLLTLTVGIPQDYEDGEFNPPTAETLFAEVEAETGIDFRTISEIVMFSDLEPFSNAGLKDDDRKARFAFIARGSIDSDVLYQVIKEKSATAPGEITYRDVLLLENADTEIVTGIIENEVIVIGTQALVQATIDVDAGETEPFSGRLLDAFDSLGDPWIKVVMTVPEGKQDYVLNFLEEFAYIERHRTFYETMGLAYGRDAGTQSMTVLLDHVNPESAGYYANFVNDLLEQFDVSDSWRDLLEGLGVSLDGSRVMLTLTITDEQLETGFMDFFGRGGFGPGY